VAITTQSTQGKSRIAEANRGKQDSTQEAEKRGWLPRAGDFTIGGRAASQPPDHFEACQPGNHETSDSPQKTTLSTFRAAESAAVDTKNVPIDPALAALVAAWPRLSASTRKRVLGLVWPVQQRVIDAEKVP
jgi:hypothetical protein